MLGLPKSTEIKKIIPKNALFAKFNMNTAAKERFDADIRRITLVGEVSKNTVAISQGETVSSFFVLLVSLKQEKYDEKNIVLLSKLIDQNMLIVLEFENKAKLAIYHTKLMTSEWKPIEEYNLTLSGLDLDAVWQNIVVQIGQVEIEKGKTLDEQIATDELRNKLLNEIEKLDKKARSEKQPKKKFELAAQVKKLKKQLNELGVAPVQTVKKEPTVVKETVTPPAPVEIKEEVPATVNSGETVKALSLLPEWAASICDGLKTVEWRTWKTDYRGELLICASSRKLKGLISGYALCMVNLVDVVPFTKKHLNGALMDEMPEPAGYAWIIDNVRLIKPFPYKGKLHLYDVDASLVEVLSPVNTKEADEEYTKYYKPLLIEAGADYF